MEIKVTHADVFALSQLWFWVFLAACAAMAIVLVIRGWLFPHQLHHLQAANSRLHFIKLPRFVSGQQLGMWEPVMEIIPWMLYLPAGTYFYSSDNTFTRGR